MSVSGTTYRVANAFWSPSRLLKNSPHAAGLVGLLGSSMEWIGVGGRPAAGLGAGCGSEGHHVGASASSLGSRTRL